MTEIHGLGCLPSPPDPLDFPISQLYAATGIEPAVVIPPDFDVGDMGTPLNQGTLPQCVAYGSAGLKRFQDRLDQGAWFAFNTGLFFTRIGGGQNGAYPRDAYAQLLKVGYPLASGGGEEQHRVAAYYAVPLTIEAIQQALMAFGPIGIGMSWYSSFSRPVNGVLPSPAGASGGHFIVIRGWRTTADGKVQLRLRNSWGASWGVAGDCWLPAEYLSVVWEAWKAVDQVIAPPPPSVLIPEAPMSALKPLFRLFDGPVPARTLVKVQAAGIGPIPADTTELETILRVVASPVAGWLYAGPDPSPRIFGPDPVTSNGVPSILDFNARQVQDGYPRLLLEAGQLWIWSTTAIPRLVVDVTHVS